MTAPDSRDSVLLPCPFCGNADVDVMYAGEVVYVACRGCDAEGSKWRTEKTAVKHWNNRQALARGPQQAGGEDGGPWVHGHRTMDDFPVDWEAAATALREELTEISCALPGVRFMDPPDGGSPSVAEQVRRMADALEAAEAKLREAGRDAERYRWLRDRAAKLAIYSDVPVDVLINGKWRDKPGELDAAIDMAIEESK